MQALGLGAFASQAGLSGHRLTDAVLREAGPSGSAPARRPAVTPAAPVRRPAITPAARSRSQAPVNWEVNEEEEDFLERQVRPPSHLLVSLLADCFVVYQVSTKPCETLLMLNLQVPCCAVEG